MPDIADYFGYGKSKLPAHRIDVTICPCMRCRAIRGIGSGLVAQSEAVRFILWLKWLKWRTEKRRKHWPSVARANKRKLDREETYG